MSWGHANLLCIDPLVTDDPRRESTDDARARAPVPKPSSAASGSPAPRRPCPGRHSSHARAGCATWRWPTRPCRPSARPGGSQGAPATAQTGRRHPYRTSGSTWLDLEVLREGARAGLSGNDENHQRTHPPTSPARALTKGIKRARVGGDGSVEVVRFPSVLVLGRLPCLVLGPLRCLLLPPALPSAAGAVVAPAPGAVVAPAPAAAEGPSLASAPSLAAAP